MSSARRNFSDPAIRSALFQAVNGSTPRLESSGLDENLEHRGRRRGDRPFLYVPTVNAKPIPLRGGGRGGATETLTVSARSDDQGSDTIEEANHLAHSSHQVRSTSCSNVEEARPYPAVCSISTPVNSGRLSPLTFANGRADFHEQMQSTRNRFDLFTPVNSGRLTLATFENGRADFHEQMQSTRNRLASLEAEQRKLIDTSLGALVKAACAISTPGRGQRDSLPSASTFTCRSPLGNGSGHDRELPGETMMVLNSDAAKLTMDAVPSQSSNLNMERLEDENRLLREAISRARMKNDDIVAKCKEAETRSTLLQEENMCAAQKLSTETGTLSTTAHRVGVDDPTKREAARRDLLHLSSTAGKALEDLFTRRSNLQAIMDGRSPEPAVDGR